jgi:hypothetical protein
VSDQRRLPRQEKAISKRLLEARSSILIKSGGIWQKSESKEKPVWEFRHLTFQEYLAARAILDGRYSGRDKDKSIGEQVAPLAHAVEINKGGSKAEVEVPESWREALRLVAADCKDDDVDDVLLGILSPITSEDAEKTRQPRAVLAALCLADEPNVAERTAECVLENFAKNVNSTDGHAHSTSNLALAALEIAKSTWGTLLKKCLVQECISRPASSRWLNSSHSGRIQTDKLKSP